MPSVQLTAAPRGVKSSILRTFEEEVAYQISKVAVAPGDNGRDGEAGADGRDGRSGEDGGQGPKGQDGRSGQDGLGLTWKGTWNVRDTFNVNDVVNYLGSTYIAVASNVNTQPNSFREIWNLMASAGASGNDGADGADGADGGGAAALKWNDYVMNWSSEPTQVGTTSEGQVYLYTYDNGTAYRLVPTDGISVDTFYDTFSVGVLSGFIVDRGMEI